MSQSNHSDFNLTAPNFALTNPTLHPWDARPTVIELQELLKAHGFQLGVTGEFDSRTEDCVLHFQRRHQLRVDAVVGRETWIALKTRVKAGTRSLRKGFSGADVYELQGLLKIHGYPIQRDGIFGNDTHNAVIAFQQHHKLRDSGIVDHITWTMLRGGKK